MSNWSKIIVCWPSIDNKARSLKARLDEIDAEMRKRYEDPSVENVWEWRPVIWHKLSAGAADGDDTTKACEHVAVGQANNWDPSSLLTVMSQLEWEYPDHVEVFWKNENHATYQRCSL